eukprot:scaffold232792_cov36-Tisochrysis_lutea.AAC.2
MQPSASEVGAGISSNDQKVAIHIGVMPNAEERKLWSHHARRTVAAQTHWDLATQHQEPWGSSHVPKSASQISQQDGPSTPGDEGRQCR